MEQGNKKQGLADPKVDGVLFLLSSGCFLWGMYLAFYKAPLLKHSGLFWWSQKIFYLHLPVAWGALSGWLLVLIGSVAYIRTRKESWDTLAVASAEACYLFATMVLVTGPIWAKPSWNSWWRWSDPRLMSFLALWLMLGAYFLLRTYGGNQANIRLTTSALGVLGAISVPFVYLSVKYGTFHPKPRDMQIGSMVRLTVWVCNFSFFFLFLLVLRVRRRLEEQRNRLSRLKIQMQELES